MLKMAVSYSEHTKIFEIRTARSSYLFGVMPDGTLGHLYWGDPVKAEDCGYLLKKRHHSSFDAVIEREAEEYGGWGECNYAEPGMKATFGDGVRDLRLRYFGHEIVRGDELIVRLKDEHYALYVDLRYTVRAEYDIVERSAFVRNEEAEPVRFEQVMSALWAVSGLRDYRLTHVTGRWAGEFQLRSDVLSEGKKVLESRQGFTGSHANPWFALDNGHAGETHGQVWFGALGWSGNWKIVLERTTFGHVRVAGGIHDFDGAFELEPGETFETPVFAGGYSAEGFGDMSRKLHRYQASCVLPTNKPRKVLYNSWEATEFAVTAEGQLALARKAAKLGVERFVVDDGWFGARHSDRAGLGDWQVNPEKFPNGLDELIDEVKGLGMEFGLWVEPESVNPDSELYRKHPDWAYGFPTREGTQLRNQLLLNLGKPEVKAFVLDFMTELLSAYDISFIKWDMNRTFTEPGGGSPLRTVWIDHVRSLYEIWGELRLKFPNVEFETCAGGGSRIDLGMLRFADQAWISDNTDALDRLGIQEGFSFVYSPAVMMCWVTESPHGFNNRTLPLSFRFRSSMMGGLGIGANIGKWSEDEMAEAAGFVELYKEIRPLIMGGGVYRLSSLRDSALAAYQYVGADAEEAVVFAFKPAQNYGFLEDRIVLQGLDPAADYVVRGGGALSEDTVLQGCTLMGAGIPVALKGDYSSALIRVRRVAGNT